MNGIRTVSPERAKRLVSLQLQMGPAKRGVLGFVGHRGDGKTQVVKQAALEAGYAYYALYAAQQDAVDFTGVPHFDPQTNTTIFARPTILPPANTKAVLVLEELNRAPAEVRQACMQLFTDRKIGMHELPEDVLLVVCINPANDIYDVSELDSALTNRVSWMHLKTNVEEVRRYGYLKGWHDTVLKFLGVHPDMLSIPTVEVSPSPRTWEMVSDWLNSVPSTALPEEIDDVITGYVGSIAAVAYRKLANNGFKTPVTGQEVLSDYSKVKDRVETQKERNSDMWYTVKDLVACIETAKKTKETIKNLVGFARDLKPEWQQYLITKTPGPVITKMCQEDPQFALFISEIKTEIMKLK